MTPSRPAPAETSPAETSPAEVSPARLARVRRAALARLARLVPRARRASPRRRRDADGARPADPVPNDVQFAGRPGWGALG